MSLTCDFTVCKHNSECGKPLMYINYLFAVRLCTYHVNPCCVWICSKAAFLILIIYWDYGLKAVGKYLCAV